MQRRILTTIWVASVFSSVLSSLFLMGTTQASMAQGREERGQSLAESRCAGCHAVGREGESKLAKAPPFRVLSYRYPIDYLAEALAEGIVTGHKDMPEFEFEPDEIDDLLAYMKTLRDKK